MTVDIHPSPTGLMRYDQARQLVAQCARIDDAAEIRDKAAALAAYARQRDDHEMQAWVKEIHLRACVRIGELSRELETAERARTDLHPAGGTQTKTAALAEAGISTSTAHRYEELAGGRDAQASTVAASALDSYLAGAKAKGAVPTMRDLRNSVRGAVKTALGIPDCPRSTTPAAPAKNPLADAWIDWTSAVQRIAEMDVDLEALAGCSLTTMPATLAAEARGAIPRLQAWLAHIEEAENATDR